MTSSLTETSLDALWMPFTANRAFKRAPRLLTSAEGMYYRDDKGQPVLDAVAGLWCVNAGHCRAPIVEAIQRSAATLDYAPGFSMAHPLQFELAERLTSIMPAGLDRVFFTNSGSEAVDTALKIVIAYHAARGDTARRRFVGRLRGYHGVGFGGISVGGIENNRKTFASHLLPFTDAHLPATHGLPENLFSRGMPEHGAHLADALQELVRTHGGETIAAVIVEPLSGSAGVLVPPVGYLQRLRSICDAHGILLIFDEVITGFGRLGSAFGAQKFAVIPDIITVAKGVTNGTVPLGAAIVQRGIHDAVVNAAHAGIEFFHGYTYSGHPLACAAALATLDVYRDEDLFVRSHGLAPYWESAVHALRAEPYVTDIRNLGLVAGIELASVPEQIGVRGAAVMTDCFQHGLLVRVTGDTIALSPPLIVEHEQIDMIIDGVRAAIRRLG